VPVLAGDSFIDRFRVTAILRLDGDDDGGIGKGSTVVVSLDLDVEYARSSWYQLTRAQQERVLLAQLVGEAEGINGTSQEAAEDAAKDDGNGSDDPGFCSARHGLSSLW
jgi:hypothetical protein